jgi:hypothetical protein
MKRNSRTSKTDHTARNHSHSELMPAEIIPSVSGGSTCSPYGNENSTDTPGSRRNRLTEAMESGIIF